MSETKRSEELQTQINQMREWISDQPHLPKDTDDFILLRFLHSCYYDLEKAKKALDLFFTLRGSAPELFDNRDPLSQPMKKTLDILNLAQIEISGNRNLWIWQLNDPGLDNYDYLLDAKVFLLTSDAWMLNNRTLQEADIVVMDLKDITLKFITKLNFSVARKISKYQEDAMPIRLKQVHLINSPPYIDKLHSLMKAFLKPEIQDMIKIHMVKSPETLYQYLDKEDLPQDYGGVLDKMEDHNKRVFDTVIKHRETLTGNLWRAIDKKNKKSDKNSKDSPKEVNETSFRSLAID